MTTPETMVREAQVNLAYLYRFASRMAQTPEGAVYLRLLNETAGHAIDWAIAHCMNAEAAS